MRHILLDMLVATRPQRTLFEAFLEGRAIFGAQYKLVEDIRLVEESYGSLLKMSLGLSRITGRLSQPGEIVGLLMPNAAPAMGLPMHVRWKIKNRISNCPYGTEMKMHDLILNKYKLM